MHANPDPNLEQQYQDLTPKQKAVIDAHAENPDATNRKKAKLAAEKLQDWVEEGEIPKEKAENQNGEIKVNESYSSSILNQDYADVAAYREEIVQNDRQEGKMQTVGDPFSAGPENGGFQGIQDRPVKQPQDTAQTDESDDDTQAQEQVRQPVTPQQVAVRVVDDGVLVKFDNTYFKNLLEGQELPPHLHQQLVNEIWANM